jgi:hypothetical protein
MLPLVLAAICFAGIHLGIAGTTLRDRVVAVLGEGAHGAVFSIVSLVAIAWLVMAYRSAPYVMSTRASPQGKPRTGVKPSPFASGAALMISATLTLSLRCTVTEAPSRPRQCPGSR